MKRFLWAPVACTLVCMYVAIPSFAGTVTVELTGVNGATQGGVYADPYFGTINGLPATLVCDDFSHETSLNEVWQADVSTFADLSGARFQQGTTAATLEAYDEAAYLYGQLFSHPSEYGDISFALWALFTPGAESSSGFTSGASAWLNQAEHQTYYSGEFPDIEILTPVDPGSGSPQEFLTSTPEPAAGALFGIGLIMLGFIMRKRRLP